MTGHSHYYHRRSTNQRSLNESVSMPQTPTAYPGITSYSEYPEADDSTLYSYNDTVSDMEGSISTLTPSTNAGGGGLAGLLGGGGNSGSGGGGLSKLLGGLGVNNMSDIKGLIDRMGGIEGIVNNIGKIQKVVQGVQQLAPMVSLLAGALGKKKGGGAQAAQADTLDDGYEYRPRRRRSSGSRRRPGTRRTSGYAKNKRRR